jgi:hypothetical protein
LAFAKVDINCTACIRKKGLQDLLLHFETSNYCRISPTLEQRLTELESQFGEQGEKIEHILQVIRQFVQAGNEPRKPIGFKREEG